MSFVKDILIILFVIVELVATIYGGILISQFQNIIVGLPLCIIGSVFTTDTVCYLMN